MTFRAERKRSKLYLVKVRIVIVTFDNMIDQPFVMFVHDSASVLAETSNKCTATRSKSCSLDSHFMHEDCVNSAGFVLSLLPLAPGLHLSV